MKSHVRRTGLAAEIPPRHQRRGLAKVMLQAMTGLARDAGLTHLIAPVRPTMKDRYPTIPIERYARWTRPDGTPFDPWVRVHTELGARIQGSNGVPSGRVQRT